jgi:hypothetical protein
MEECQRELDKSSIEPVSVGVCEDVMGTVLEPFNRKYVFSRANVCLALIVLVESTARRCV